MSVFTLFQLIQIALGFLMWSLIGQGVLALLIGQRRHVNAIYRVFQFMTWPAWSFTRAITPRFVADPQVGYVAFFLLGVVRLAVYLVFYRQGWIPTVAPPQAQ